MCCIKQKYKLYERVKKENGMLLKCEHEEERKRSVVSSPVNLA